MLHPTIETKEWTGRTPFLRVRNDNSFHSIHNVVTFLRHVSTTFLVSVPRAVCISTENEWNDIDSLSVHASLHAMPRDWDVLQLICFLFILSSVFSSYSHFSCCCFQTLFRIFLAFRLMAYLLFHVTLTASLVITINFVVVQSSFNVKVCCNIILSLFSVYKLYLWYPFHREGERVDVV